MFHVLSRTICLLSTLFSIYAEVITFEKSGVPNLAKDDGNAETHLPLSSLFSQSDRYACLIEGKKEKCSKDDVSYMKDKFGEDVTPLQYGVTKAPNSNKMVEETVSEMNKDGKVYFGPRYQPVHLYLPRKAMYQVGHKEKVTVNHREMKIKVLSQIPYIFEVSNFLSTNETELMIDLAKERGVKERTSKVPNVVLVDEMEQRTFDVWDTNFDGKVSADEIGVLQNLNGLLLTKEDIINLISLIDKDEDGYLSFEELSNEKDDEGDWGGGIKRIKKALEKRELDRSERKRKGGHEAWVWHDEDELLAYENLYEDFHQRISKVTDIPEELVERSEPIQVLQLEENAFASCNQDSEPVVQNKACCTYGKTDCRACRYMSMFVFLSDDHDGGELAFPIADNETFHWQNLNSDLLRKCELAPNTTTSKLVIKPETGKAIFWYNHEISPYTGWMGQLEARTISGITPVQGQNAWSAKMWLNIIGDGVHELKPWRMASNWLKSPNKKEGLIERLRNDFYREGEPYLHVFRESYKQKRPSPQRVFEDNDFLKPLNGEEENSIEKNSPASENTQEIVVNSNTKDINIEITQPDKAQDTNKVLEPIGPELDSENTPSLGFHPKMKRREVPLGPPKRPIDPEPFVGRKVIENGLLKASLLLVEELEREELEILARNLHEKLQLNCIPLIVNPIR
ncbi:transmembrane prolyl 4-hydroxylase-like [Clytia hemisphaerica]|uniref:EF-hand domain-containing protein n=1 Tax=Clytia hemisphaerica TaxID=252671 RepID=A0A7M5XMH2_9CNID